MYCKGLGGEDMGILALVIIFLIGSLVAAGDVNCFENGRYSVLVDV